MSKKTDTWKVNDYETIKSQLDDLQRRHFKQAYWFWLGIIVGLSILIIAYLIVNKDDCYLSINRYVGFAATLLSIVMSIFAIMYTYTSNQQIGEKFKDIDNAAHEIHHTAEIIRSEATNMNQRMDNLQSQLNTLYASQFKSNEKNNEESGYGSSNKKQP